MKKNPDFSKFVHHATRSKKFSDLTFLLIAPVQRLPRYVLFLKDLVKYTHPDHMDYNDLKDALHEVKRIAKDINKEKARFEDTELVFEVAARFDREYHSKIVSPSRVFIHDVSGIL